MKYRGIDIAFKSNIAYEPKFKNKFVVEFPEEFGIESWMVNSVELPKWTPKGWGNIAITLLDFIGPSTSKKLVDILADKKKFEGHATICIKLLDPVGAEIESWKFAVEKFEDVDFGSLSYHHDELKVVTLTIKPVNVMISK